MLLEVLVSLSLALLFLTVLSRGFGMAWGRSRLPAETTWALAQGRRIAEDMRNNKTSDVQEPEHFRTRTTLEALDIRPLESALPPAPRGAALQKPSPDSMPQGALKIVAVRVTGPSGRSYDYETIKLDLPPK